MSRFVSIDEGHAALDVDLRKLERVERMKIFLDGQARRAMSTHFRCQHCQSSDACSSERVDGGIKIECRSCGQQSFFGQKNAARGNRPKVGRSSKMAVKPGAVTGPRHATTGVRNVGSPGKMTTKPVGSGPGVRRSIPQNTISVQSEPKVQAPQISPLVIDARRRSGEKIPETGGGALVCDARKRAASAAGEKLSVATNNPLILDALRRRAEANGEAFPGKGGNPLVADAEKRAAAARTEIDARKKTQGKIAALAGMIEAGAISLP